ncbi:hypothetical protein GEV33_001914 [Tenebrio molitor]|uniref:Uncharacterized protein n=1 Tax=Tenebrio molitor TaxID=7067 RepID=A0A8J6HUI8_TENMO|nr:hypothetical protein GEV33_001914 [Tenebrio molitor]
MATEVSTFVQLPREDLQKLLDEEREENHQRLAIWDGRIHVLEEGQKMTDVSPPPNSPAPGHPEQAEPSIEMEEVVESAPEPPFKEVRGRRSAPAKPVAQQKPPAESKIPPIIIRDASKWPSISSGMQARRIAFTKAKPCVDGIRVHPGESGYLR